MRANAWKLVSAKSCEKLQEKGNISNIAKNCEKFEKLWNCGKLQKLWDILKICETAKICERMRKNVKNCEKNRKL